METAGLHLFLSLFLERGSSILAAVSFFPIHKFIIGPIDEMRDGTGLGTTFNKYTTERERDVCVD